MKTTHTPIRALLVLAFAISTLQAFAADKTNEGAKSSKAGQEVVTSSEGVKVHQMKTTEQMKERTKAQKEREAKGKK
ncbi:hypothetical protein [Herbaspirillum sp. NPDC101396]|uniref:hypothetical protein n=1 Tax=Herbaspirillum sp. NPDC101396 TaxID=3364005 RepID=UPI00383BD376